MTSVRRARTSRAHEPRSLRWQPTIHRGDLFRVRSPDQDPKRSRVFVVVSRSAFLRVPFSSAICAPIYSQRTGSQSEVEVGPPEGLKQPSAVRCDLLTSLQRQQLTDYVGALGPAKLAALKAALRVALEIE